jgi:hypothetical protein
MAKLVQFVLADPRVVHYRGRVEQFAGAEDSDNVTLPAFGDAGHGHG